MYTGQVMTGLRPPLHVIWSTDKIDLSAPFQRRWYIQQVLFHGRAEDVRSLDLFASPFSPLRLVYLQMVELIFIVDRLDCSKNISVGEGDVVVNFQIPIILHAGSNLVVFGDFID